MYLEQNPIVQSRLKGLGPVITTIKWLSFVFLLSLFFGTEAQANTITAATCNQSDVNAVINGPTHTAVDGDTVIIPSGSCTWTASVNITVAITLQGQTTVSCPTDPGAGSTACTSTNNTSITDNIATTCNGSPCPAGTQVLNVTLDNAGHTTIAGINFIHGSGTNTYITIQGTYPYQAPLVHDVVFDIQPGEPTQGLQWIVRNGVLWNFIFNGRLGSNGLNGPSFVVKGDIPWDSPSTTGTADTTGLNNMYVETGYCHDVDQWPDTDENTRIVIRHNYLNGCSGLTHGNSSGNGGRQVEYYNNRVAYPSGESPARNLVRYFWWRAGTGLVTRNNIDSIGEASSGGYPSPSFAMSAETAQRYFSADGCSVGYMARHQAGSGSDGTVHTPSNVGLGYNPSNGATDGVGDNEQISDPIYFWSNTGNGQLLAADGVNNYQATDGQPNGCNTSFVPGVTTSTGLTQCSPQNGTSCLEWSSNNFVISGRDYFVDTTSNPSSGAKPGWSPYPYPHPLTQGGSTNSPAPAAPTGLIGTVE